MDSCGRRVCVFLESLTIIHIFLFVMKHVLLSGLLMTAVSMVNAANLAPVKFTPNEAI